MVFFLKRNSLFSFLVLLIVFLTTSFSHTGGSQSEGKKIGRLNDKFSKKWLSQDEDFSSSNVERSSHKSSDIYEAKMTTVEIIANRGYPIEIHSVTTEDGYILELHRIPYGKGQSASSTIKRRAVFLQHGFLNTDNVWLIQPSDKALAYILADNGYDVWLGNARGSTYSTNHVFLNPKLTPFWNFSLDEMGIYDQPAVIDYVLAKTGLTTLSYIGHSTGCTMFFICMASRPEYNAKIDLMVALSPLVANVNTKSNLRFQAPFINLLKTAARILGIGEYNPVNSIPNTLRQRYCGPSFFLRKTLCRNSVFRLTGDDYHTMDKTLLPLIDGHNPGGGSVRTAIHIAQIYNTGRQTFQAYDFGPSENLKVYDQSSPPAYDFSKVTCPVYIFWGPNDKAADPKDVAWLAGQLGNVVISNPVDDALWNHDDMVFSYNAKQLVYDQLISILPTTPVL